MRAVSLLVALTLYGKPGSRAAAGANPRIDRKGG